MSITAQAQVAELTAIVHEAIRKIIPPRGFQGVYVSGSGELSVVLDGVGFRIKIETKPGQF